MKPQKYEVIEAVREILKTQKYYSLMDIVQYLSARGIKTTRREVMLVVVEIIQQGEKDKSI